MLQGLMQDRPLMISSLIEHAASYHPDREIVVRTVEGPILRTNYATVNRRAKQLANALAALGVTQGDRVGTLAWNTHRHLELYYGVSGSGAVLHTVNPRLFPEQITYIVNHGEAKVLFFDITFADMVAKIAPSLTTVKTFVAMTDREHLPNCDIPGLLCYEDLLAQYSDDYVWPEFDERSAASMCYTSGTTGNPKGVVYSHRSTLLQTLMACGADNWGVRAETCVLLIVPMFHTHAWGMPYSCAMAGAKLVLPGPNLDGQNLYELIRDEKVNTSQAVPTVWLNLFHFFDSHPEIDPKSLGLKQIVVGGSAAPASMIERIENDLGALFLTGWGMTESSALGVVSRLLPGQEKLPREEQLKIKAKQGRGLWGVEMKIVDDEGVELPRDGKAYGNLLIRGHWVASSYFRGPSDSFDDKDGWFFTGDVATIDPNGFMQLVDRAKDVIKSGGEWISSIDVENAAIAHPAVLEAAVIGVPHPKWVERPLLIAVRRPGQDVSAPELLDFLKQKLVSWWIPDDVVFVDELPHTATGKLQKTALRQAYGAYRLPNV